MLKISRRGTFQETRLNEEISNYKKSIEKLAVFFAEGKITEESYLRSVKSLEDKISNFEDVMKNPASYQRDTFQSNEDNSDYEKPTILWYLAPLFFGLIGGLIAYVGTKDRDKDMASYLLVFGIFMTLVFVIIDVVLFSQLASLLGY